MIRGCGWRHAASAGARTGATELHPCGALLAHRTGVDRLTVALGRATETVLLRRRSRWERLHGSLQALSPKAILARGYALVFDASGQLVKRASQLKPGDQVRTQLGPGRVHVRRSRRSKGQGI